MAELEPAPASTVAGLSPGSIELGPGLSLPLEVITETIAILANRGAGKSACAHRLVEQMHRAGLPVVVIDVKGDWWGIRSSADGTRPGLPFVIFGGDHADVPLEPTAGELLADLVVDDRIPAVLDLSHMSKTKARTFATAFATRLYVRNRDALHVVIEESDVLIPQRASADTARLLGAMEDIAKRGRSRGLGLTLVTQRPQEVAKSVLELMETVVLLRMTGTRSIKAAQDWISVNADNDATTAREIVGSLPSLTVGEGWVWSPAFLRRVMRVKFDLFETFDSHATPKPGQARIVPKRRADIDLKQLGAEIAATVERAKEHDPRTLQATVRAQHEQLGKAHREISALKARIAELEQRPPEYPAETAETLTSAARLIESVIATITTPAVSPPAPTPSAPEPAAVATMPNPGRASPAAHPKPASVPTPTAAAVPASDNDAPRFRAGAQRMLESLARMAPLRLTKAQWGTVARMKHTGGTWSTYLGELRRAGLVDEDHAGFTLTAAGWEYVGGQPAPITGEELQQHYLSILRRGAARMLQAIIDAYPAGLTTDQISTAAEIAATGGTFSTYLGELRRNGLVEKRGDLFVGTEILMRGAGTGPGY